MIVKMTSEPGVLWPAEPGTYILTLHLPFRRSIGVGKLGEFDFPAGHYLYVGSALGPGGLAARLRRHQSRAASSAKRLRWHVDFLREQAQLLDVWYSPHPHRLEHKWASAIGRLPYTEALVPGFGSSDCKCPSHLYYVASGSNSNAVDDGAVAQEQNLSVAIKTLVPEINLIVSKGPKD